MCGKKPTCGSLGKATDDTLTALFALFGIIGGIGGAIGAAADVAGKTGLLTILGVSAPVAVWIAALAAGLATLAVIGYIVFARCNPIDEKQQACSSGVIQHIEPSFSTAAEEIFPFAAMHDRVDVVVVCDYWFLVEGGGALFVKCAPDRDASPMLLGFYYSKEVCAAGAGALYGGAAALVPGIIAGAAVGAAIGCATVFLCLLALLVAALIVVAAVLIGAFAGGQIGKALAGDSVPSAGGEELSTGDLVTTKGGLITNGDQDGARTYWWVDSTVLHGRSPAPSPYSHVDAEAMLKDPTTGTLFDACGGSAGSTPGSSTGTFEPPR